MVMFIEFHENTIVHDKSLPRRFLRGFKQTFQMRVVVFLFVLILFAVITAVVAVAASFRAVILVATAILLTRLPASLLA